MLSLLSTLVGMTSAGILIMITGMVGSCTAHTKSARFSTPTTTAGDVEDTHLSCDADDARALGMESAAASTVLGNTFSFSNQTNSNETTSNQVVSMYALTPFAGNTLPGPTSNASPQKKSRRLSQEARLVRRFQKWKPELREAEHASWVNVKPWQMRSYDDCAASLAKKGVSL